MGAIASQSEGYIRRLGDLEGERRTMDNDRVKLLDECAELQAKLENIAPQLETLSELESRHEKLVSDKQTLADEGARLRTVNAALTALLLGDDAPPGEAGATAIAESLGRVLQLHLRLAGRVESH